MTPIEVAISQIGVEEEPHGSNWGDKVEEYLASVGIHFPASWCMAFVYWCHQKALGANNPLIKTGGVLYAWNNTDPKMKFKEPKVGDIFIMDFGHGKGHTGIIERIEGDKLYTIEGNTNDEGVREGYEVCRRIRITKYCKGFIRRV
jgi:hypothetical protein